MEGIPGYSRDGSQLSTIAAVYGKRPNRLRLITDIIRTANIQPGCELLEVGCGEGITSAFLADYLGAKVIGVDLEPRLRSTYNQLIEAGQPTRWLEFCLSDAAFLPFSSGRFDCIWCESTLSTVIDKLSVVNEFRRLIKPGGKLIVLDFVLGKPITNQLQELISFLPCLGRTKTTKDYIALFESHGFEAITKKDYSDEVKKSGYWLGRVFGSIEGLVCNSNSKDCVLDSQDTTVKPSWENFKQFLKEAQLGYCLLVLVLPL